MKKALLYLLLGVSLILIILRFGYKPVTTFLNIGTRSGLKITSLSEATVSLNGKEVGKTPFTNENLIEGEYQVRLENNNGSWQGQVKLSDGTISVINREITPSIASSSGEVLTLSEGKGIIVTSTPDKAEVEIDGKSYGKTPLTITELEPGEHLFLISHEGYLKRSIKALLPPKLLLRIDIDLAINESLVEQNSPPPSPSLVDLIVKQTPNGFLRVRSKPATTAPEIGRVATGETISLVEELSGWMKVKLKDGKEGYVSSSYLQKVPN